MRVRDKIPLSRIQPDYSSFLEAFPIGEGFKMLFQFTHPFGMRAPIL